MDNSPLFSVMVLFWRAWAKTIVSPVRAAAISARSEPVPLSATLVTVSVLGSQRPSSASRASLLTACLRETLCLRPRESGPLHFPFRSQEMNHMMLLLSGTGLRYKGDANRAGAQTERRGAMGPMRDRPGRETSLA